MQKLEKDKENQDPDRPFKAFSKNGEESESESSD